MGDFNVTMGTMIRELRESKNVSQKELADRLKIHKSTLSLWESGKRQVSIGNLWQITEHLSMTDEEKEQFYKSVVEKFNPEMMKVMGWDK